MNATEHASEDELNPRFLFNTTHTELLAKIASGEVDPVALAKREMAIRGLDRDGRWVGTDKAFEVWGPEARFAAALSRAAGDPS